MQRVEEQDMALALKGLISSSVSGSINTDDDAFAAIRGFEASFRQIKQTPQMVRILIQNEFAFDGVVNAWEMDAAERARVLATEWYDATFLVADYSDVVPWVDKAVAECERGKLVVALVPARTNTLWFHEKVLKAAKEVRFIRGEVVRENNKGHSATPDCLVVYKCGITRKHAPKQGGAAIIRCRTDLKKTRFSAEPAS